MSKVIIVLLFAITVPNIYSQTSYDLNKRGTKSFQRGEYDLAIADFTRAIEKSSSFDIKGGHLPSEKFTGDRSMVDSEAEQITVLDPLTAAAYVNRGKAYFAKGGFDQALSDYEHALSIVPTMTAAYLCRGIARVSQYRFDLATSDFEKVIKLDPRGPDGYIGRAVVREAQGDRAGAARDLGDHVRPKSLNDLVDRAGHRL